MTREISSNIEKLSELRANYNCFDEKEEPYYNALSLGIKALKQESCTVTEFADRCQECGAKYGKLLKFAEWVASEIFDENWEYNKDAFEELACRKLAKLGLVRANGDEWELVESEESEEKLSWLGKSCKDCGNEKCKKLGTLPRGYDCALWQPKMENYSIKTVTNAKDAENYHISEDEG